MLKLFYRDEYFHLLVYIIVPICEQVNIKLHFLVHIVYFLLFKECFTMTILQRMIQLMENKKIKWADIARHLGVSRSVVGNWKMRETNPPTEYIVPICELLNVSVEFLLTGTEKEKNPIPVFYQLSVNKQEDLRKYSEYLLYEEMFQDFLLYKEETQNKKQDNQDNIISISKVTKETSVNTDDTLEVSVPMKGYIAAGQPITLPDDENTFIDDVVIKNSLLAEKADFSLQVKGDSMYPLINDGDIVFIKIQPFAEDGQIVVASINNATTLKKLQRYPDRIELHAINPKYPPIIIDNECIDFRILGVKL